MTGSKILAYCQRKELQKIEKKNKKEKGKKRERRITQGEKEMVDWKFEKVTSKNKWLKKELLEVMRRKKAEIKWEKEKAEKKKELERK